VMWLLSNLTSAPGVVRDRVGADPDLVSATVRVMCAGGAASMASATALLHISAVPESASCLLRCGYTLLNTAPQLHSSDWDAKSGMASCWSAGASSAPHNQSRVGAGSENGDSAGADAQRRDLGAVLRSFLRRSAARERLGDGARGGGPGGGGGGRVGSGGGGGWASGRGSPVGRGSPIGNFSGGGFGSGGGGVAGGKWSGGRGGGNSSLDHGRQVSYLQPVSGAGVDACRVVAALLSNVITADHKRHVREGNVGLSLGGGHQRSASRPIIDRDEGESLDGGTRWPLLGGSLPDIVVALSCSSDTETHAAVAPAVETLLFAAVHEAGFSPASHWTRDTSSVPPSQSPAGAGAKADLTGRAHGVRAVDLLTGSEEPGGTRIASSASAGADDPMP
jgi:hypothetical protein